VNRADATELAEGYTDEVLRLIRKELPSGPEPLVYPRASRQSVTGAALTIDMQNNLRARVAEQVLERSGLGEVLYLPGEKTLELLIGGRKDGRTVRDPLFSYRESVAARRSRRGRPKKNPEVNDHTHEEIVEGFARALFVMAWAGAMEERGRSREMSGKDLMDLAPATPPFAVAAARICLVELEQLNFPTGDERSREEVERQGGNALASYFEEAFEDEDPNEFGHYLAMEMLGHGVAWSDSREPHDLKVPDTEFHMADPDDMSDGSFWFEGVDTRFAK
jgi:hypothetical protein